MIKNDSGRHFSHMSPLSDISFSRLSSCVQTHKNTCTGLLPWLQEDGQQGLGRELVAEARVSCVSVCDINPDCLSMNAKMCVFIHCNWRSLEVSVCGTFFVVEHFHISLSKTTSVSNMRLIQAGWYYMCLTAWEIDKASIKGIPVKGC